MKTSIKSLIAASLSAIVLSTAVITTTVSASEIATEKTFKANKYRRISVTGNVEVTLIQRKLTGVVYADDNTGTVKVMQEGDNLKITSRDKGLTKIIVYVNDFFRIEASENAVVRTEGKLTTQYLQVFLKGTAHADINTCSEGLYTVIEDHADLKLSGSTDNHILVMGDTQKLTIDKFAALHTDISSIETLAMERQMAANNK